eukprot:9012569-Pyramimonas_sp.AAC.1
MDPLDAAAVLPEDLLRRIFRLVGSPEGVQRGSRGGPEEVRRGSRGGQIGLGTRHCRIDR